MSALLRQVMYGGVTHVLGAALCFPFGTGGPSYYMTIICVFRFTRVLAWPMKPGGKYRDVHK